MELRCDIHVAPKKFVAEYHSCEKRIKEVRSYFGEVF